MHDKKLEKYMKNNFFLKEKCAFENEYEEKWFLEALSFFPHVII